MFLLTEGLMLNKVNENIDPLNPADHLQVNESIHYTVTINFAKIQDFFKYLIFERQSQNTRR